MPKESYIQIKLFANLQKFMPSDAENHAIQAGTTVGAVLEELDIAQSKIKLVFVDGVRAEMTTILKGGERVGVFPPVGGG